jgi:hypothetical protein
VFWALISSWEAYRSGLFLLGSRAGQGSAVGVEVTHFLMDVRPLTFLLPSPAQICIAVFIGLLFTRFWLFSVLYATWFYLDIDKPRQGGRRMETFRRWVLWKHMKDYFPVSVSIRAALWANSGCQVVRAPGPLIVCPVCSEQKLGGRQGPEPPPLYGSGKNPVSL